MNFTHSLQIKILNKIEVFARFLKVFIYFQISQRFNYKLDLAWGEKPKSLRRMFPSLLFYKKEIGLFLRKFVYPSNLIWIISFSWINKFRIDKIFMEISWILFAPLIRRENFRFIYD